MVKTGLIRMKSRAERVFCVTQKPNMDGVSFSDAPMEVVGIESYKCMLTGKKQLYKYNAESVQKRQTPFFRRITVTGADFYANFMPF